MCRRVRRTARVDVQRLAVELPADLVAVLGLGGLAVAGVLGHVQVPVLVGIKDLEERLEENDCDYKIDKGNEAILKSSKWPSF